MSEEFYKKVMKGKRYKDFRVTMWHSKPQICYLCGYKIEANTSYSELSYELDHIIPASVYPDGIFEEENVLLTHKICNQKKGDRQVTPQMQKACQIEVEKLFKRLKIDPSQNNTTEEKQESQPFPIDDSGIF